MSTWLGAASVHLRRLDGEETVKYLKKVSARQAFVSARAPADFAILAI